MFAEKETPLNNVYTITALSTLLKQTVEDKFGWIKVRGEISSFKKSASGHVYFTLKDERAILNVICWKNVAGSLSFQLEEGMEVICSGKLSTYPGRSIYQLTVSAVTIAGVGALLAMLEKRKKQLQAEGLFNLERKQALPFMPQVIGIVTSAKGAVIKDIIHRIKERFPIHLLLRDVAVQGPEASSQVAAAITGFNRLPPSIPTPDLIIVARGGGSIDDLWAFNEEIIVRAVAASKLPVISAIGHETDTTLIDYAADKRAPTPTAAAEIAVPVREELIAYLNGLERRLKHALPHFLERKHIKLHNNKLRFIKSSDILRSARQKISYDNKRLRHSMNNYLKYRRHIFFYLQQKFKFTPILNMLQTNHKLLIHLQEDLHTQIQSLLQHKHESNLFSKKLLASYSYKNTIKRGFAIAHDSSGKLLTAASQVKYNTLINIEFHDGIRSAIATRAPKKKTPIPEKQKSLWGS